MVSREATSTGVKKPSSQDGRRMLGRNCSRHLRWTFLGPSTEEFRMRLSFYPSSDSEYDGNTEDLGKASGLGAEWSY